MKNKVKVKHLGKVRKPPPAAKLTYMERQEAKMYAARLYGMGYTQVCIAQKIAEKYNIGSFDQSCVSDMLRETRQEWKEEAIANVDTLMEQKIAEIREVRREAYEAWVLSKEPLKKVERTKTLNVRTGKLVVTELIATIEHKLPYDKYLTTILSTLQMEIELRGLAAPTKTKVDMTTMVGQVDWDALLATSSPEVREKERQLVEGGDPIESAIASVAPQVTPPPLPSTEPSTNGRSDGHI